MPVNFLSRKYQSYFSSCDIGEFQVIFVSRNCPCLASMSLLSFSTRIINIIVDIERNVCEVQLRERNNLIEEMILHLLENFQVHT